MKRTLSLWTSLLLLAGPVTASASLIDGLHAYWDFDGGTDNHALATGGAAFNGTLLGGATTSGTPVIAGSGALLLDGVDNYMNVANSVNVNQPWSVSAWYWSEVAPATTARGFVYEGVGSYAMSFGIREGSPTTQTGHQVFLQRTGGDLSSTYNLSDADTVNNWHHIMTVLTPSTPSATGSLIGYLDGQERYALTIPANSIHPAATGFNVGTYRSANGRWFQGSIDEVAIWTRSLTLEEAQSAYALGQSGQPLSSVPEASTSALVCLGLLLAGHRAARFRNNPSRI